MYAAYVFLCTVCYSLSVDVSITQFRRNLFSLMNQALEGTEVWVTHKGSRLRIVPEKPPGSRLSRITPMEVVNYAQGGLEDTGLLEEMTRAWEADWERDFGPAPEPASRPKGVEP